MQFKDIIGQKQIKDHLQGALRDKKVSHAYLINGEAKSGKMMMAQAFVQALFCENGIDEACGECPACKKVEHKNHPDFIYVTHEKPNTISVKEIREQLVEDLEIRPYSASHKVYVIEEAEKMSREAQNALLKSLEEPPEYGVILLLTNNASSLLSTIRSRCVTLNIRPVEEREAVRKILIKEYQMPEYEAEDILNFAQGNVGKAIALATGEEYRQMMDDVLALASRIHDFDQARIREKAHDLAEANRKGGLDLKEYFDLLVLWYRDVLLYKATSNPEQIYFKNRIREIKRQSARGRYSDLKEVIDSIDRTGKLLRSNIDAELSLTMLMQAMKEI